MVETIEFGGGFHIGEEDKVSYMYRPCRSSQTLTRPVSFLGIVDSRKPDLIYLLYSIYEK